MYYVELLRASRSLRTGAILAGIALLLNILAWKAGNAHFDAHLSIPITIVWAFAGIVTSIFASVLGGSLSAENDGHLPVAWTKPVSRSVYAATTMAIDFGAIAAMFAIMCVAVFAYFQVTGLMRSISVPADAWSQLFRFFIAPAAFFGLLQALTAPLGRRSGMVLGFTWAALTALVLLASSPLPQPYHAVIDFINNANPLVYVAFEMDKSGAVFAYDLPAATMALVLIAVIGAALAIYRWQRVEA